MIFTTTQINTVNLTAQAVLGEAARVTLFGSRGGRPSSGQGCGLDDRAAASLGRTGLDVAANCQPLVVGL